MVADWKRKGCCWNWNKANKQIKIGFIDISYLIFFGLKMMAKTMPVMSAYTAKTDQTACQFPAVYEVWATFTGAV